MPEQGQSTKLQFKSNDVSKSGTHNGRLYYIRDVKVKLKPQSVIQADLFMNTEPLTNTHKQSMA